MTNSKSTKRALVVSALAILLCVTMLIGTTFAWFTDTASTSVNTIKSGTLKLALEMVTGTDADGKEIWEDATGTTLDFKKAADHEEEEILWEPGCTYELPKLRIRNDGTLALKYKVAITGIKGDAKLNEVIEWTIDNESAIGDDIPLKPEESKEFTIKGHMLTTAGNEYQDLSITGISITVLAAQYTFEVDSKNDQYDKDALYPVAATNQEELDDKLNNSTVSEINLTNGEYSLDGSKIYAGTTLAGESKENTTVKVEKTEIANDDITIKDMTIIGKAPGGNSGALNISGENVTVDNVNFVGQGFNGDTKAIAATGNSLQIKNTTISNAFRGIIFWDNIGGDNVIENCVIDNVIYTFNINAATVKPNTTLTVKNSTLNGWTSYSGCMEHVTFENCNLGKSNGYAYLVAYADSTFTNCTFNDGYQVAAGNGSAGKTLAFTNCKLADGTLITAENFVTVLGDVDDDLRAVVVIVDGVTVNWG